MKLFTIGPTEMYDTTKEIRKQNIPYFRTDEFSADMLEMDKLLKEAMGTSLNSKGVYLTASGTAALEAVVMNCFDEKDKLLIVAGGSFGERFVEICQIHKISHDVIRLESNEALTENHLNEYRNNEYTALLVNLHETSTGQLYDIKLLSDFCHSKGMYLIVDAISTFLCDEYKMDDWGISASIISTQKGLCVTPGMAVVMVNEQLADRIKKRPRSTMYFDFNDYFKNIERGQTPFTPAVGIVYEILDMLRYINKIGLDNQLAHIKKLADVYRENICSDGISIPTFNMSNAITVTRFEKPVATKIYQELRNKYCMCVNPSGGELGVHSFRVSHVGNLTEDDMRKLAAIIKELYAKA